jgi:hypothetical protein
MPYFMAMVFTYHLVELRRKSKEDLRKEGKDKQGCRQREDSQGKKKPDRNPASCKIQYPMKNRGETNLTP